MQPGGSKRDHLLILLEEKLILLALLCPDKLIQISLVV